MINILITGENSYIGRKFIEYISEFPNQYTIESISVRGDGWKEKSFGKYDSVIHVAGIAHKKNIEKSLYYSVNKDLSKSVAQKAKEDGVHQFIYLSSMAVFGKDKGIIDKNTKTSPKDNYGKSKLLAEGELFALETNNFQVAVVRPPMVYGENAPGNYQKLCKLSRFILFFPDSKNTRSMIFIDNLSKFLEYLVLKKKNGLFHPQDNNYVNTFELLSNIRDKKFKRTYRIRMSFLKKINISLFNKVFGDLYYSDSIANKIGSGEKSNIGKKTFK